MIRPRRPSVSRGFTLVEVLIALAVLAIALVAFVSAGAQNADYATYIRDRSIAEWVGRNQLVEYQLQSNWPSIGKKDGEVEMSDSKWRWEADIQNSPDPQVRRIDMRVYATNPETGNPDSNSIVLISGFITQHPQAQNRAQDSATDDNDSNNNNDSGNDNNTSQNS